MEQSNKISAGALVLCLVGLALIITLVSWSPSDKLASVIPDSSSSADANSSIPASVFLALATDAPPPLPTLPKAPTSYSPIPSLPPSPSQPKICPTPLTANVVSTDGISLDTVVSIATLVLVLASLVLIIKKRNI